MNLFSLEGKIAFVTGAGSGIGQRIAVGLAEAGASVGCFDLASSSGLKETVKQIEAVGCRALALTGDVTQADNLAAAISTLENGLGPLSVAVNCAGIANAAAATEMPKLNGSGCSTLISRASFSLVRRKAGRCCPGSKVQ